MVQFQKEVCAQICVSMSQVDKHVHPIGHIQTVSKENPGINDKHNQENEPHPLECIFSNMEIASIAIHATISVDILDPKTS